MKYFKAKRDSKIDCLICGEKILKGFERAQKRIFIKEFGEIYSNTLDFHKDCYMKSKDNISHQ